MSDEKFADGSSRPTSLTNEKDGGPENRFGHLEHIAADLKALDVGLTLVAGHGEDPDVSPQESKRIRRKIDRHLLPLLFLVYTGE